MTVKRRLAPGRIIASALRLAALALAFLALAGGGSCHYPGNQRPAPSNPARSAPTLPREAVGINMHPERYGEAEAERQFALCRELGITQIRISVEWQTLEPERGEWDFEPLDRVVELGESYGLSILQVLCYNTPWNTAIPGSTKTCPADLGAWEDFVRRLAERYRGRILWWEIWNEPNTDTFLTGPYADQPERRWSDYREILARAFRALKGVSPDNQVVFGGLAHGRDDWWRDLEACYAAGAVRFCDALAIHPYAGGDPRRADVYPRYIDEILAVMKAQGDAERPVWITEVGLPTAGHPLAITEDEQAAYLADFFLVALARPAVQKVFLYALVDDAESFGLYRRDGSPKPAAQRMRELMTGTPASGPSPLGFSLDPGSEPL